MFFNVDANGAVSEQTKIFSSFYQTLVQMHIYLTTANSPDVMIPAFSESFLSFLFFGSFLTIGLWFLMPLLLAGNAHSARTRSLVSRSQH